MRFFIYSYYKCADEHTSHHLLSGYQRKFVALVYARKNRLKSYWNKTCWKMHSNLDGHIHVNNLDFTRLSTQYYLNRLKGKSRSIRDPQIIKKGNFMLIFFLFRWVGKLMILPAKGKVVSKWLEVIGFREKIMHKISCITTQ